MCEPLTVPASTLDHRPRERARTLQASTLPLLPLQSLDGSLSLPGILTTLVVIVVARVVLSIALKMAVIAGILWALGLLEPLSGLLGV